MGYTTVEALDKFGEFDGELEEEQLHAFIQSATAIIESYTQRKFDADEETSVDYSKLNLPTESRFSGPTLYFHEELADEASAITDSPTVIYLPEDGPPYWGCYKSDGSWAYPTVTVTGYWGYSKTPPPDIEIACLRLSLWLYNLKDVSQGDTAVITPEGKVLLPQGLPADVAAILKPYRKVTSV